ncbi:MAG TPA: toprim domain-containing protein [Xanthobacteraceae bacterium]
MQKLALDRARRNSISAISWDDVERITKGRLGVTVQASCPLCSEFRSTREKRRSKCLGVQLRSDDYAVFNCLNCGAHGNVFRDAPAQVIDLAERQRIRDRAKREAEEDRRNRTVAALRLWDEGQPFRGSLAEDYLLHTRGIGDWLDVFPYLDEVFRFHPACPYGSERLACMLSLIRSIHTDEPQGIQRTPLWVGIQPKRLSLGIMAGGAIKISPDHEVHTGLLVGEGVESVFSLSRILSHRPIWSLIDRINLGNFPVLPGIEYLVVAADNDLSGDGMRDAVKTAERWSDAGREVEVRVCDGYGDFNDLLLTGAGK